MVTPEIRKLIDAADSVCGRFCPPEARHGQVRAIWGTLAISDHTLREDRVEAAVKGGGDGSASLPEASNARDAYDRIDRWVPHRESDLLRAHGLLLHGLSETAGAYRGTPLRIRAGTRIIHEAPHPERVPELMETLLAWLPKADTHPLVTGALFHCELEFIHPFADGNGRLGRLWQRVIWKSPFGSLPIESYFYDKRGEYFAALKQSTRSTDCAPFVEFALKLLLQAVTDCDQSLALSAPEEPKAQAAPTPQEAERDERVEAGTDGEGGQEPPEETPKLVLRLLSVMNGEMSGVELQEALDLRDRKSFRERYLAPALQSGFVEMTIPGKPNSRNQKYRATEKAQTLK